MVRLHEHHLRSFLATWKRAKACNVALPETDDPDYVSLEALLLHVCRAARGYMWWMCRALELPDPGIRNPPDVDHIETEAEDYVDHLARRWDGPLTQVPPERFEDKTYPTPWDVPYCIDSMLEHAVMHPIRHEFQLKELMGEPL